MRILMAFIIVALVSIAPPAHAAQPQSLNSDLCLSIEPGETFPHYFENDGESLECITIDGVSATFTNSAPVQITLQVTGQRWREMNGDIRIDQRREDDTILVSIYREIDPIDHASSAPYQETIPLAGSFDPGTYTIRVNEYSFEIAIPDAPPPGGEGPSPRDDHGFVRSYVDIQSVDVVRSNSNHVTLHITGSHVYNGGTCATPLQIEHYQTRGTIMIEIYRLIDVDRTCTTERDWVDEYVRLDQELYSGSYLVQVNDYHTEISIPFPQPEPQPIPAYAQIDYVEVLPTYDYPAHLTLHVVGSYASGCQDPLRIEQRRSGNWVYVDLYQMVDPRVMCPQMLVRLDEYIPLEGRFDYGTYVFQVNGYILSYTFPIYDDIPPMPLPMPID
jgi:hypothetical protein